MNRLILPLTALISIACLASSDPSHTPKPAPTVVPVHCQVPCGIYGDKMRIDMLMEDTATIEKGMKMLQDMDKEEDPSKNQVVRWVMNKDDHAQAIQNTVASYWLAQRIKTPAEGADAAAQAKYGKQLELMHRITVAAMKCKQTTDSTHPSTLRSLGLAFSKTYFSAEDLEHIRHGHGEKEGEHR
jgi:nickel superoxide dismutase